MKLALWALGTLLIVPTNVVWGQQQQQPPPQKADQPTEQQSSPDPVAEAARRTRELKKEQPKAAHVWTDDNIPRTPNYGGQAAPATVERNSTANTDNAASPSASASNDAGAGTSPISDEEKTKIDAELARAKEHLQSLQTDLDILQRTHTLDEQMYLSKPDHEKDMDGAAKMKDEEDQIAAKQQEITDAQKHVDELQAQLSKSSAASNAPAPH